MKEWASARQRVQELKAQDPKGAETLNKDITHVGHLKTDLKVKVTVLSFRSRT